MEEVRITNDEVRSVDELRSTKDEVRSVDELRSMNDEVGSVEELRSTNDEVRSVEKVEEPVAKQEIPAPTVTIPTSDQPKVSALSLSSIKAKKELAESQKAFVKEEVHLPSEPFTETQMLEQWFKYAQRLEDKGHKIVASLLTIDDPKLDGTTIVHELPNESSKIDFEKEKHELLGYLRGKLHNHDISITIMVNENLVNKKAFTAQDKYNRLREINPNLELMKTMFDLDF